MEESCRVSRQLTSLLSTLKNVMLSSKADKTVKNYQQAFIWFANWCKNMKLNPFSVDKEIIGMYLVKLSQDNCSAATLNKAFYGINWIYTVSGREPNPCGNNWLKLCLDSCRRQVAKPTKRKEPITQTMIQDIVKQYVHSSSTIMDLRIAVLCLLSYAGFLRFSEAISIRRTDITFNETFCCIYLPQSKTDVYRQGQHVLIARTGNMSCPVATLERYLAACNIASISDEFIFRGVQFNSSSKRYVLRPDKYQHLSYTRTRELLHEALKTLGYEIKDFCLHSLRSGAVSRAAGAGISDRLLCKHARWRSDKSKNMYIKDDVNSLLSVSLGLGL